MPISYPASRPSSKKSAPRIDQQSDELAHRLLPLLGKALRLGRPADVVGLLAMLEQERILLLPVFLIGLPLLLLPLGPRQPRFRLFSHLLLPFLRDQSHSHIPIAAALRERRTLLPVHRFDQVPYWALMNFRFTFIVGVTSPSSV